MIQFVFAFALSLTLARAAPRAAVIFDIDHTLVDTNHRIVAILKDLAVELDIPELKNVTPAQAERLRRRDRAALGLDRPEALAKLFGRHGGHGAERSSAFGAKFFNDARYVDHDRLMTGAAEFVAHLARSTDADVYYITGRFHDGFDAATRAQLAKFDFPGFSARHPIPGDAFLILKPTDFAGPTDEFKVRALKELSADHAVVAVFDDSRRNVLAFAEVLAPGVPIVRVTRDVNERPDLPSRIEQITDYTHNRVRLPDGGELSVLNGPQLDAVVVRAKACARALGDENP